MSNQSRTLTISGYEKPTAHVGLRLPPSIATHWKAAAKAQSKTLSDWLRAQIYDLEIRMQETHQKRRCIRETIVSYQRVDPELIRELVRVGNNLNQIAKQMNRATVCGQQIDVVSFIAGLVAMQRELHQVLNDLQSKNSSAESVFGIEHAH